MRCGCFTSLSMTKREMRCAQHDKGGVIPNAARNPVCGCFTSLAFVQHDRKGECAPFSMTGQCHSERSEESSAMWMLRFAQHGSASARHWGTIGSIRILFKVCIHLILILAQPNQLATHLLFDKHHFSCFCKCPHLQAVDVDSTCQTCCIEMHLVCACRLFCLD